MDPLLLAERVQRTIQLRESQFREFKSAWAGPPNAKTSRDPKEIAKDIAEVLTAFANADGGELLIGVEDDGTITGVPHKEETISKLLQVPITGIHQDTPLVSPIAQRLIINNYLILYFSIEKSTVSIHQTSDGRCLQRKDLENRPVSATRLQFERQEQISREYDREFVDDATVLDLNLDLIRGISDQLDIMSPEKCLQYLNLAEYGMGVLRLRRAALLLFALDVLRWHPRCQVRIVKFRGTELKVGREYNAVSDKFISGNILELIPKAWEKLRPFLVETKMMPDALFRERIMYPEDACREALINAITHRDYSVQSAIEIHIFDDRMEVHSPGSLLSSITVNELRKLQGRHESRNVHVARVLREMGYIREMGEGMRRIYRLMREADLVSPDIISESRQFSIVLRYKSVFSDEDQRLIDNYQPLNLSREEMFIILMGKDGKLLSPQQILDGLGLVDWDVYRVTFDKAQTKGIIYDTMSRQQKYKARGKGRRNLARLAVRTPRELDTALTELSYAIKQLGAISLVDRDYADRILQLLSPTNPYKRFDPVRMIKLLEILGLVTFEKQPTPLIRNIWS